MADRTPCHCSAAAAWLNFLRIHPHWSACAAQVLEHEKRRNLEGKTVPINPKFPGWNEKLASDAEAIVKAESCDEMPIQELQERTVEYIQRERHEESTTTKTTVSSTDVCKEKGSGADQSS